MAEAERFDLESDDVAGTDIDDAGIFAGPLHHQFAARGQLFQMDTRTLVGAVLAPHNAENAEFGKVGSTAQNLDDLLIFIGRELVLRHDIGGDGAGAHTAAAACSMDWKTTRPSEDPISGSVARSGWGIMPITLRSRFRTPAILRSEPLGLSM